MANCKCLIGLFLLNLIDNSQAYPVNNNGETVLRTAGEISNVVSTVVALVVLLIFVAILFGCVCCRPGKGFQEFRNGPLSSSIEFVNPAALPGSELTIFPPPGAPHPPSIQTLGAANSGSPNTLRPASFSSSEHPLTSHDWFLEPHLNFPRNQLHYLEDYGRGWFGRVVTGEAVNICPPEAKTKVIVKILHEDATATDQMFFLHEVKPHRDLQHPNILRLLGRCLEMQPFLLLLEYCPNGDLKSFLQQSVTVSGAALSEQGVLLRMMRDVTAGLDHMHKNKLIHTDLAARNCMLTNNLTVKIGDYGNGIELFPGDYYKAGCVALPVRWAAPETLRCTDLTIETRNVTAAANAWTLAVVMWEICEFGRLPYDELTDDQVIVHVLGERTRILPVVSKPCRFSDELYHVMKLCWNAPLQRPTVEQIAVILNNLVSCGNPNAGDFEERWEHSKPNTIPKTDNAPVLGIGARVGDSSCPIPIAAFGVHNKPIAADSPRFHLGKADSRDSMDEEPAGSPIITPDERPLDSWLQGVQVKDEEDEKFVRNVSEAIRDLDMALALEKTSSSEETSGTSSKHNSPGRHDLPLSDRNEQARTVDFKLGPSSYMMPSKPFELSSLQNTMEPQSLQFSSLIFNPEVETEPEDSITTGIRDAEDDLWASRIERGEFSQKVKEKSRSIADLMILTHIEPSDDSDDGENPRPSLGLKSNAFGSDSDIRHAVLDERFHQSIKKLSDDHKEYGRFDSINMIVPDEARRASLIKTLQNPFLCESYIIHNQVQQPCASSSSSRVDTVPDICIDEVSDSPEVEEDDEEIILEYPKKALRFVMKDDDDDDGGGGDDDKTTVEFGPFEDAMLGAYQCVRTETTHGTHMTNMGDTSDSEGDCVLMRTPDDERSSDSGFRDKGSLSESVEDADPDVRYNLDDIDAELDQVKNLNCLDFEESQLSQDAVQETSKDDLSDIEGEIDLDTEYYQHMTESSPIDAKGWYLNEKQDDGVMPLVPLFDQDFVNAIRNELANKLPLQCRSFEVDDNRIVSSESSLEPIIEEDGDQNTTTPVNGVSSKNRKKNCVGLMESVKNIDTLTFINYLDFMVENEGRDDDVSEEAIEAAEDETLDSLVIMPVVTQDTGNFEQDIETALAAVALANTPTRNPVDQSVLVHDLESDSLCHVHHGQSSVPDDVILVDVSTNEATLLEGSHPQPHVAFMDDDEDLTPSQDSSMGEASTDLNSSPDLLSDFFITPDKTPLQSPRTVPRVTAVHDIVEHEEAQEIMGALVQLNPGAGAVAVATEPGTLPVLASTATDELLRESSLKLQPFEMSTSFMGEGGDDDDANDWDTGSSDNDQSSSSTEFIWKDGAQQAQVKVKQASFDLQNSDDDESSDSSSESASVTDFVPSAWDSQAAPVRSALRTLQQAQTEPDGASQIPKKRRVWFKKQKYHCIYEYPREPSDPEDTETNLQDNLRDLFTDWEPQDTESDPELRTMAAFDDGTTEDGEFFVSSTARPFETKPGLGAMFTGSEFTPFWLNPDAEKSAGNNDSGGSSSSDSGVDLKPNVGIGRAAREGLTLDFPTNYDNAQFQFQAFPGVKE